MTRRGPNPSWRRKRPRRTGWAFDAAAYDRCWCGWYPPNVPGRKPAGWVGHAATCPVVNFRWIVSEEQLAAQRVLLMAWAEAMEKASSDPGYLLEDGYRGDWRQVLDVWRHGLVNAAVRNGWEKA